MSKFTKHQHGEYEQYCFHCPGCKGGHAFTTKGGSVTWTVSGESDDLTFSPSLLCNSHDPESRCHSFVRNGRIQFLSDCFHELAGQTVEIPDLDAE